MEREQMNWENELATLEESSKSVKSMKYNKGVALKDSKGFNGTALAIGIVEYFMQRNSDLYILKHNTLNGIVNRLINLYGEDILYDVYVNSPTKLEELMGQHQIDYKDFAGLIDLHYKNLTKDPNLAESFLNQDIDKTLSYLEQVLGKEPEQVVQNENSTMENIVQTSFEKVRDEKEEELSQEEPKVELKQEVSKTESQAYDSNFDGKAAIEFESDKKVDRPYFVKSIETEEVQQVKLEETKKEEISAVENLTFEQKIEQMAQDVIAGKYGSGIQRKQALGELYNPVQARANQIAIENARKNQFGYQDFAQMEQKHDIQIVQQSVEENDGKFELVKPKQEQIKKQNMFKRGWQKFSNGFKRFFGRIKAKELLALNPGTVVEEEIKK